MVPDTVSRLSDTREEIARWIGRRSLTLTARILLVNLLSLALFAGGLFFLDSFRTRLLQERMATIAHNAQLVAWALPTVGRYRRDRFLDDVSRATGTRIRLYDAMDEHLLADTDVLGTPAYRLRDPRADTLDLRAARIIDALFDLAVGARRLEPFIEPVTDDARAWPEIAGAPPGGTRTVVRRAPDGSPVINAAAMAQSRDFAILMTQNAEDLRQAVRDERTRLSLYFLLVLAMAILLSLFLARTIVTPIRRLAIAAVKVRRGRAREVAVPRLPDRRDEIGMLARALSDMSNALRARIDATEAFAADVAHELKNPLASLRSALDSIEAVSSAELRGQLVAVAQDDVHRLDRLVSDISDASRLDAQLARAQFERIDLAAMLAQMLLARRMRSPNDPVRLDLIDESHGDAIVLGEDIRLERVFSNLIDNAVSFSPEGAAVTVRIRSAADSVTATVEDRGIGVPPAAREAIFDRFHSTRPAREPFGRHSGLGLAIARAIVEGHQGRLSVHDRDDGDSGAVFEVSLPRAGPGGGRA